MLRDISELNFKPSAIRSPPVETGAVVTCKLVTTLAHLRYVRDENGVSGDGRPAGGNKILGKPSPAPLYPH
jgi:hypothetical protein